MQNSSELPKSTQRVLASLRRLRIISLIEGWSFIILLAVAMPLRKWADLPIAVTIAGSLHGYLWIVMLAAIADSAYRRGWGIARIGYGIVASIVPGGPFVFEASVKREELALLEENLSEEITLQE